MIFLGGRKLSRFSRVRGLALVSRGMSFDEAAHELAKRTENKGLSVQQIRALHFPLRGIASVKGLEGASREEIAVKVAKLKEHAKRSSVRMKKRFEDPRFGRKIGKLARKRLARLEKDPRFVAKRNAAATRTISGLNSSPAFIQAASDRLVHLHQTHTFSSKVKRTGRRTLKRMWRKKDFAKTVRVTSGATMRRLHTDPEFARKNKKRIEGLNRDVAFRQKVEAGQKRFWANPRNVARLAKRTRALNRDPEFREKVREGRERFWANPVNVAWRYEESRRLFANPDFMKKFSAGHERFLADPRNVALVHAKIVETLRTPEHRQRATKWMKYYWSAPENAEAVAKHRDKIREGMIQFWSDMENVQRMQALHKDPKFKEKIMRGIRQYWEGVHSEKETAFRDTFTDRGLSFAFESGKDKKPVLIASVASFLLDEITNKERAQIIKKAISNLAPFEARAVELVFGFSEFGAMEKENAANMMGLKTDDFEVIFSSAVAKLASDKKLKGLL